MVGLRARAERVAALRLYGTVAALFALLVVALPIAGDATTTSARDIGPKQPSSAVELRNPPAEAGSHESCRQVSVPRCAYDDASDIARPITRSLGYRSAPNTTSLIGKSYGTTGTVVPNPGITIKGFQGSSQPGHALNRIINRGVKPDMLLEATRSPRVVLQQAGNRYLHLTDDAAVAITGDGQVVTAWTRNEFYPHIKQILRDAGGTP